MTAIIPDGSTVVFAGDSITDATRTEGGPALGAGYVLFAVGSHSARRPTSGIRWVNAGVSGDRVVDLEARWEQDVLSAAPDVLSVLIGINDVWRRYDSDDPTTADEYREGYRRLLASAVDGGVRELILIEPFLIPVGDQLRWREDLDPKIQVVRELAREFGAHLLAADGLFAQLSARTGSDAWAADGVHPTLAGHRALADGWLALVD